VIAWSAALLLYIFIFGLGQVSDGTARLVNNIAWTVAATLAAISSFRASNSLSGRERSAWLIFGFACAAWLAGQLVWNVYEFYFGVLTPFPSYADIGYLAYGPLMLLGLSVLRATQQERKLTWLRAANLGLILCSLAVVLITTFRQPFIQTHQQLGASLIVVGENASIALAFIVALYFLWSYRWGNRLLAYTLLMLSLGVQMISGLLYTRGLVVADYSATSFFNIGWILGFALQQWAAETQVKVCARVDEDIARLEQAQGWVEALVPSFLLLCIVITAALLAQEVTAATTYLRSVVLIVFAAILALREAWLYSHGKKLRTALDSSANELMRARGLLNEMHDQRRQLERVIELTARAGGVGLWEWEPTSNAVRLSAEWKRQLGYAEHELSDDFAEWRERLHPDDRDRVLADLEAFLREPRGELMMELRLRHRDGSYRWILTRGSPLYDASGRLDRMFGSHVDITRFKELEQSLRESERRYRDLAEALESRVSQRTLELTEAYRESRSFAYAVAHDLKAPLRAINGFCALLAQSAGDRLTQVERSYIERASQGAMRMSALIEDLLNYSRIEHREQRFDAIDCKQFVEKVLSSMTEAIKEARAKITVNLDSTPVLADGEGLRIALANLLENALKFSRETEQPRIDIESNLTDGRYILKVRDNGIGFDPVYHDNIFQIFNRLHASGYEGTGIGLALVRKAVQRMGGEVWAEGVPGQGATFFVSLRLAESTAAESEAGPQRVGTR
jgi:PAS domain S-box-containing protein